MSTFERLRDWLAGSQTHGVHPKPPPLLPCGTTSVIRGHVFGGRQNIDARNLSQEGG
jgi:hypothetical protein